MTPEYLEELANIADPFELWRKSGIDKMQFNAMQRIQVDTGVYLRRFASHQRKLLQALETKESLLITPLSPNGVAQKIVATPDIHKRIRDRE